MSAYITKQTKSPLNTEPLTILSADRTKGLLHRILLPHKPRAGKLHTFPAIVTTLPHCKIRYLTVAADVRCDLQQDEILRQTAQCDSKQAADMNRVQRQKGKSRAVDRKKPCCYLQDVAWQMQEAACKNQGAERGLFQLRIASPLTRTATNAVERQSLPVHLGSRLGF